MKENENEYRKDLPPTAREVLETAKKNGEKSYVNSLIEALGKLKRVDIEENTLSEEDLEALEEQADFHAKDKYPNNERGQYLVRKSIMGDITKSEEEEFSKLEIKREAEEKQKDIQDTDEKDDK